MSDERCNERITVLEVGYKMLVEENSRHREREEAYMEKTQQVLQEIRDEQSKQKGFYAGAIFVVSGIFTLGGAFAGKLFGES